MCNGLMVVPSSWGGGQRCSRSLSALCTSMGTFCSRLAINRCRVFVAHWASFSEIIRWDVWPLLCLCQAQPSILALKTADCAHCYAAVYWIQRPHAYLIFFCFYILYGAKDETSTLLTPYTKTSLGGRRGCSTFSRPYLGLWMLVGTVRV